jgi:hypothetical protein
MKRLSLAGGMTFAAALTVALVPGVVRGQPPPPPNGNTETPYEFVVGGATLNLFSGGPYGHVALSAHCHVPTGVCDQTTPQKPTGYVVEQVGTTRYQGAVTCLNGLGNEAVVVWKAPADTNGYRKALVVDSGNPSGTLDSFADNSASDANDCGGAFTLRPLQSGNFVVHDPAVVPCIALTGDSWSIDSNCKLSTSF